MSILNWIRERETEGQYTFSVKEAQSAFPAMSSGILQNELFRLSGHREITAVHKGFYVRIPARYRNWEFLPAYFYIDQLMEYLKVMDSIPDVRDIAAGIACSYPRKADQLYAVTNGLIAFVIAFIEKAK